MQRAVLVASLNASLIILDASLDASFDASLDTSLGVYVKGNSRKGDHGVKYSGKYLKYLIIITYFSSLMRRLD